MQHFAVVVFGYGLFGRDERAHPSKLQQCTTKKKSTVAWIVVSLLWSFHNKEFLVLSYLTVFAPLEKTHCCLFFDKDDPSIAFSVEDIKKALLDAGYDVGGTKPDLRVVFDIFGLGMGPQAFRIRREGDNVIRIVGGDSCGAMYGGLELAEMVTLGGGLDAVQEIARKPYVFRRGLKFNIPFDARAPSYDDTGTAAQKNIPVMWDFAFWRQFLDTMARNRYNVLTLWTTHPYPGLVKLDNYAGVGYDDVCVLKEPVDTKTNRHFNNLDIYDRDNFKVIKKISLDEKIAFWQRVFDHAEARGIEIYIFHWNIYTFGARGRHGIDDRPDNAKTQAPIKNWPLPWQT